MWPIFQEGVIEDVHKVANIYDKGAAKEGNHDRKKYNLSVQLWGLLAIAYMFILGTYCRCGYNQLVNHGVGRGNWRIDLITVQSVQ
jgi:hypothetical protein